MVDAGWFLRCFLFAGVVFCVDFSGLESWLVISVFVVVELNVRFLDNNDADKSIGADTLPLNDCGPTTFVWSVLLFVERVVCLVILVVDGGDLEIFFYTVYFYIYLHSG